MISEPVALRDHVWLIPKLADAVALTDLIKTLTAHTRLRQMQVPGGKTMSVAMTNCGELGWVSDQNGYRYSPIDPLTDKPWPQMPAAFAQLAQDAAARCGFDRFEPDACLINCYGPKAQLGLHRDSDEQDFSAPIVSVSLGAHARFTIGGLRRQDPKQSVVLSDGDVMVWGGPARRIYHGVGRPLAGSSSDGFRYNLTFRKAA